MKIINGAVKIADRALQNINGTMKVSKKESGRTGRGMKRSNRAMKRIKSTVQTAALLILSY